MTIAFVSDNVFPPVGGQGVSAERFIERFAQRGHRVVVLTTRTRWRIGREELSSTLTIYRCFGMVVPGTRRRMRLALPFVGSLVRILRHERVDVVHLNVSTTLLGASVASAAKLLGLPTLAYVHTQADNLTREFGLFHQPVVLQLFNGAQNAFLRLPDVVVTPTAFAAALLQRQGLDRSILAISNGVDVSRFVPKSPDERFLSAHGLSGQDVVLSVGRLATAKNLPLLLAAFARLPHRHARTRLVLVGDGFSRADLEWESQRLGIASAVVFTGRVSDDDLLQWYQVCTVFVHPSVVELESLVVLEAMASGKPVVVARSPTSAATELVDDLVNGFHVSAEDPAECAEKLETLLARPDLRVSMGAASRQRACERDIEKSADQFLVLYERLLAPSTPVAAVPREEPMQVRARVD